MTRRLVTTTVALIAVTVTVGCGGGNDTATGPAGRRTPTTVSVPASPSAPPTAPASAPLGTAPVTTTPPAFSSAVAPVTAADLGASWREGCPVGADQLRRLTLAHWDFDGVARTGALVVHADVVDAVTAVFRRLFDQRVPIRRMDPIDRFGGSDDASMAADNTSAFNCRLAVTDGPAQWSVHAYGRAIDVNPVENPYVLGSKVLPPEGGPNVDRTAARPGMAVAGGPLVEAFLASGWQWGGRWAGSPDYQHFSADGG